MSYRRGMTDDGNAPTVPDTQAPTHGPTSLGPPKAPDARYALRALLGKGGMGEVWLAHDLRIDRDIAIKLMRGGAGDTDAVARFLREARVQGRLEHPTVVPVHDLGDASSPFLAMKRLTGTTLAEVIANATWSRRTLLARFVDVCLGIEFAHQRGVIHRDLKPANIMLGDFGETYVLDWGLARISDAPESDAIRTKDLRGDSAVGGQTQAGAMLGTPGYMAPEQMKGDTLDERADVFSLGCILFEILAGESAIPRDRAFELALTTGSYRPARLADVPPELDEITARATCADREQRFATARELADAVQRFLDGDRDLARRRELAAAHATRAQQLLAEDTIAARAEAMREAGSAIALDATNRDAQAVLARLLLEPPKQIPPAARLEIQKDRDQATRAVLKRALGVYVASLLVLPIVALLGFASTWALAMVAGELVVLIAYLGLAVLRDWEFTPARVIAAAIMHMIMLATIGVILGALLVLPVLIFGSLPILLMMPALRSPRVIFVAHLLAVAVPLTLEALSIVPRSFTLQAGTIAMHPWAVTLTSDALLFTLAAVFMVQLIGNTIVLDGQRKEQDALQVQLHLQKWQLEQLVTR